MSERVARHAGFWWGFAEGTAFFIVPDVFITFAALFSLRAGAIAWGFSILGSIAGILIVYGIGVGLDLDYVGFLDVVPGITAGMIDRVTSLLVENGLPYTPLLVLGGVPLKVYGGVAASLGVPLVAAVVWTVFARIVRIAPTYLLVGGVRLLAGHRIDARPGLWIAVFIVCWLAFYVFYFIAME